jgi:hypothetical protein
MEDSLNFSCKCKTTKSLQKIEDDLNLKMTSICRQMDDLNL